jgi:rfaE bifunctional protein kinase chain/domain
MLSESRLDELLSRFGQFRIGLVGDLFLDRYLHLAPVVEKSIETGLEAYQIDRIGNSPGALGTVMNNLAALGVGTLAPLTVIGDDGQGYDLRKSLANLPIDDRCILTDSGRLTPTYTKPMRPVAGGPAQELNRLDLRTRGSLAAETTRAVIDVAGTLINLVDALIILDQINETDWGVVNKEVRGGLKAIAAAHPEKLVYTDSRQHLGEFDFGVLKGNHHEILRAAGQSDCAAPIPGSTDWRRVVESAQMVAGKTNETVFCTVGPHGIVVVDAAKVFEHVPAHAVEGPIDIVGAGDSATAAIVLSLLAGATPVEAAEMANLTASITIRKLGTTGTASPVEMSERLRADLNMAAPAP